MKALMVLIAARLHSVTALLTAMLLLLLSAVPTVSQAQFTTAITSDGTLGTTVSRAGATYNITGGTRSGSNLFHSFGLFSVGGGDTANFSNDTGLTTSNILGRITGGQPSSIFGTIRTTNFGAANLFLINPAGWIFGPTASLNVGGSFHVSTADYLKFADGAKFYADLGQQSVLTTAPVSAFGFLSQNPSAIGVVESALEVPAGNTLSLVGGDLVIVPLLTSGGIPTLSAPGGKIQLASIGSPGEVPLNVQETDLTNFQRSGQVYIQQSVLHASGNGGGTVVIRGGQLLVDSSNILAENLGNIAGTGPGVDIHVSGEAVISNQSFITASSVSGNTGNAGDIVLEAKNVTVTGGGLVASGTFGSGNGGTVRVTATDTVSLVDNGAITAASLGGSTGKAGDIVVEAKNVKVTGGGLVASGTFGSGNGGTVRVTASDTISLGARSLISTSSALGSTGNAGDIVLEARNVMVTGGALSSSTFADGSGGSVEVRARQVNLKDQALIKATSSGDGDAGNILIQANEFRSVNSSVTTEAKTADGGNIHLKVGKLVNLLNSQITATVQSGVGKGGNITIDPTFVILNHSQITANAFGGPGGNVSIAADVFLKSPDSVVSASSALGVQGTVDIQAPVTSVSGAFSPLPEAVLQATSLLREPCAVRLRGGQVSSLVVSGRDGLPLEPGGLLPSPLYREEKKITPPTASLGIEHKFSPHLVPQTELKFPQLAMNWACTK